MSDYHRDRIAFGAHQHLGGSPVRNAGSTGNRLNEPVRASAARVPKLTTIPSRIGTLDTRTALPAPKVADSFYLSPEHRAWRDEVIERAGGRCQGKLPGGRICDRVTARLFADHIIEIKDGGAPLDPANGQALCGSCHTRKTAAARESRFR